jgi:hypothetical protein
LVYFSPLKMDGPPKYLWLWHDYTELYPIWWKSRDPFTFFIIFFGRGVWNLEKVSKYYVGLIGSIHMYKCVMRAPTHKRTQICFRYELKNIEIKFLFSSDILNKRNGKVPKLYLIYRQRLRSNLAEGRILCYWHFNKKFMVYFWMFLFPLFIHYHPKLEANLSVVTQLVHPC